MSEYSVEQMDEDAMTEYIQARTCHRIVLGGYFDRNDGEDNDDNGSGSGSIDCHSTDSVFCDWCKSGSKSRRMYSNQYSNQSRGSSAEQGGKELEREKQEQGKEHQREENKENRAQDIAKQLKKI